MSTSNRLNCFLSLHYSHAYLNQPLTLASVSGLYLYFRPVNTTKTPIMPFQQRLYIRVKTHSSTQSKWLVARDNVIYPLFFLFYFCL